MPHMGDCGAESRAASLFLYLLDVFDLQYSMYIIFQTNYIVYILYVIWQFFHAEVIHLYSPGTAGDECLGT